MLNVELLSRTECHLCDDAHALLDALQPKGSVVVTVVNIDDSPPLLRRYGAKIPVVRRTDNDAKLFWPFTFDELREWVL